jgi:hypothetical protein
MRYTIYTADKSRTWGLFQTDSPREALRALANGRRAHPDRGYAVYETDALEAGDVEAQLEDWVALHDTDTMPRIEVDDDST